MDEKIIVITGSSTGIGFNLAKQFLSRGHKLVLNGRDESRLKIAVEILKTNHEKNIKACPGDVRDIATHEYLIKTAKENYGKIDIWINNAGIPQPFKNFPDLDHESIKELFLVNLFGTVIGAKLISSFFQDQGYGSIYNMEGFGSDGRLMKKLSIYGTSKRAVSYFSKSLRKEIDNKKILIGTINPGMVKTRFINVGQDFDSEKERKRYQKVLRILAEDPEKVSNYIVDKVLKNQKPWHPIRYLSGLNLVKKIIMLSFT